jgi:hypothetical protein
MRPGPLIYRSGKRRFLMRLLTRACSAEDSHILLINEVKCVNSVCIC